MPGTMYSDLRRDGRGTGVHCAAFYHITPKNDLITSAPYGTVLELRNVLVRYNKGHDA